MLMGITEVDADVPVADDRAAVLPQGKKITSHLSQSVTVHNNSLHEPTAAV